MAVLIPRVLKMETKMPDHPNLVFVFPDEYRKQAMGFMNEDPVTNPQYRPICIRKPRIDRPP